MTTRPEMVAAVMEKLAYSGYSDQIRTEKPVYELDDATLKRRSDYEKGEAGLRTGIGAVGGGLLGAAHGGIIGGGRGAAVGGLLGAGLGAGAGLLGSKLRELESSRETARRSGSKHGSAEEALEDLLAIKLAGKDAKIKAARKAARAADIAEHSGLNARSMLDVGNHGEVAAERAAQAVKDTPAPRVNLSRQPRTDVSPKDRNLPKSAPPTVQRASAPTVQRAPPAPPRPKPTAGPKPTAQPKPKVRVALPGRRPPARMASTAAEAAPVASKAWRLGTKSKVGLGLLGAGAIGAGAYGVARHRKHGSALSTLAERADSFDKMASGSFGPEVQLALEGVCRAMPSHTKIAVASSEGDKAAPEADSASRKRRLAELLKKREATGTATGSASPNPPEGE